MILLTWIRIRIHQILLIRIHITAFFYLLLFVILPFLSDPVTDPVLAVTDPFTDPFRAVTDPFTDPVRAVTDPIRDPVRAVTDPVLAVTDPAPAPLH